MWELLIHNNLIRMAPEPIMIIMALLHLTCTFVSFTAFVSASPSQVYFFYYDTISLFCSEFFSNWFWRPAQKETFLQDNQFFYMTP